MMMMRKLMGVLTVALPLVAQTPEPGKTVIRESRTFDIRINGEPGPAAAGIGPIMVFSNSDGAGVKGAPYSGDTITESVQVLADGNRITRQNKSSFYRDSEGRTRREHTIQSLGPLGQTKEPMTSITIDDPVAKVHYLLDAKSKTAQKIGWPEGMVNLNMMGSAARRLFPGPGALPVPTPGARADILFDPLMATPVPAPANGHTTVMAFSHSSEERRAANAKPEDLGIRTIEGVAAKGTRITMTIAAGEVGNERPIDIVTETWYSDQLKTAVLTIHKDPRFGETTTKLTNVRLGEPARHLFEVPADYKMNESNIMFRQKIERAAPAAEVKEILEEI